MGKKEMTLSEFSRKGGRATAKKYPKEHYRDMARKSWAAKLEKYGPTYRAEFSAMGVLAKKRAARKSRGMKSVARMG